MPADRSGRHNVPQDGLFNLSFAHKLIGLGHTFCARDRVLYLPGNDGFNSWQRRDLYELLLEAERHAAAHSDVTSETKIAGIPMGPPCGPRTTCGDAVGGLNCTTITDARSRHLSTTVARNVPPFRRDWQDSVDGANFEPNTVFIPRHSGRIGIFQCGGSIAPGSCRKRIVTREFNCWRMISRSFHWRI